MCQWQKLQIRGFFQKIIKGPLLSKMTTKHTKHASFSWDGAPINSMATTFWGLQGAEAMPLQCFIMTLVKSNMPITKSNMPIINLTKEKVKKIMIILRNKGLSLNAWIYDSNFLLNLFVWVWLIDQTVLHYLHNYEDIKHTVIVQNTCFDMHFFKPILWNVIRVDITVYNCYIIHYKQFLFGHLTNVKNTTGNHQPQNTSEFYCKSNLYVAEYNTFMTVTDTPV